jgi:hypothetical protein
MINFSSAGSLLKSDQLGLKSLRRMIFFMPGLGPKFLPHGGWITPEVEKHVAVSNTASAFDVGQSCNHAALSSVSPFLASH